MELRQLRYLLAVAEEGNFTRAAANVFVSQSALSQQIQALETEVGAVLLNRSKRGVHLTAAGEILAQHALRVMHELEQAEVAMQELEGLQRGELRVGVVQTVNTYLIPGIVAAYAAEYPGVKLWIEELSSDEIEAGLAAGELQVGIGFAPPTNPQLDAEIVLQERLALITREDHELAGNAQIPVQTLDQMPLVMLANTFCTRRLWEESAQLASAQPNVVMEMNTVSSILSIVEKTGIPTILPELILATQPMPTLHTVYLTDTTPSRSVALLWNRDNYLCAASRAFMQLTKEVVSPLELQEVPLREVPREVPMEVQKT